MENIVKREWVNRGVIVLFKRKDETTPYEKIYNIINDCMRCVRVRFVNINELKENCNVKIFDGDVTFDFQFLNELLNDLGLDYRYNINVISINCDKDLMQLIDTHNVNNVNIDNYDYGIIIPEKSFDNVLPMVILKSSYCLDYYDMTKRHPIIPYNGIDDTLIGLVITKEPMKQYGQPPELFDNEIRYIMETLLVKLNNCKQVEYSQLRDKFPDKDNNKIIDIINEFKKLRTLRLKPKFFKIPSSENNETINKANIKYNLLDEDGELITILYLVKHDGVYYIANPHIPYSPVTNNELSSFGSPLLLFFYCVNFSEIYSVNKNMIEDRIQQTFHGFNLIYHDDIDKTLCEEIYSDDMIELSNMFPQKLKDKGYIVSRVFIDLEPNPENEVGGFLPELPCVNLESIEYAQYIVLLYRHGNKIHYGFIKSRELD